MASDHPGTKAYPRLPIRSGIPFFRLASLTSVFSKLIFYDAFLEADLLEVDFLAGAFFATGLFEADFFAVDLLGIDFFVADFLEARFFAPDAFFLGGGGILAPFSLASDRPIAIACFLLLTAAPLPDFNVPFFFRRMALSTDLPAAFEYLGITVKLKCTQ